MFKALFQDRYLLLLLLVAVGIRLFALNETWVEQLYSQGFYPVMANILRTLFGWIPFSIGDLLYLVSFVWVVRKTWRLVRMLRKRQGRDYLSWVLFRKYVKLSLLIYIVFSLFWGLNYFRKGIDAQLDIQLEPYSVEDLFNLTLALQQRLNSYAERVDSAERIHYEKSSVLFQKGGEAYTSASGRYPFFDYRRSSLKPSLYTPVGHFVGFTGYYNPFTGEAQLKTSIPVFLKPFVVLHEIAHQQGYARENEASFVAYLASKASEDIHFKYSVYFELYRDAIYECRQTPNRELTETIRENLHSRVKTDVRDLRLYLLRNRNLIEPIMSGVYDRYLKLNNQPKGKATYNEVIAYMVAYMKKFGAQAI
ncbi:MAG TPA: DUF3810 domain-containing protein [Flavisolibacter sp.]|jgi:hypothetical protein|nr:DUF3810 domain-containing protein [Flavisolibacter sp.]